MNNFKGSKILKDLLFTISNKDLKNILSNHFNQKKYITVITKKFLKIAIINK